MKAWRKNKFGIIDLEIQKHKEQATKWELLAETRRLSDDERLLWKEARKQLVKKKILISP